MARLCFSAAVVGVCLASPSLGWDKLQRQVLGWLTPLDNLGCGLPPASPCNISLLAAACAALNVSGSNHDRATAHTLESVPCVWSNEILETYIPGCPSPNSAKSTASRANGCVSCQADGCYADFTSAQAACVSDPRCGGITSEINGPPWELRSLAPAMASPTNESTYIITNAAECGHIPPPPPPGSGCNAFDTNGNLYHW
jgi:hypothetical protein